MSDMIQPDLDAISRVSQQVRVTVPCEHDSV
jgi:hypothetical protein